MKVIATEKAPGAIGPYSQGFIAGGFVYTSGQIPVNPADGTVPEGIAAQTEQSCKNVGAILEAAGSGYDKVIKTTCFLADIADFAAFNGAGVSAAAGWTAFTGSGRVGRYIVGASTHPGAGIPGVLNSARALDALVPAVGAHVGGVDRDRHP